MEKELLFSVTKKDFVVQAYKGSGKGGQNRNKRETACRISHPASGAVATCEEERYYEVNKRRAFEKLTSSKQFQSWLKLETAKALGQKVSIEEEVTKAMMPVNIRVDIHDEQGRWVDEKKRPDLVEVPTQS